MRIFTIIAALAGRAIAANLGLVFAGVLLLLMQLHGYQHDSDPNSFRFPAEEHNHAHEDMEIGKTADPGRDSLD